MPIVADAHALSKRKNSYMQICHDIRSALPLRGDPVPMPLLPSEEKDIVFTGPR